MQAAELPFVRCLVLEEVRDPGDRQWVCHDKHCRPLQEALNQCPGLPLPKSTQERVMRALCTGWGLWRQQPGPTVTQSIRTALHGESRDLSRPQKQ